MAGKARSSLISLAIIAVLVFGAVCPTIVYADDSKPPDTPTAEASSACTAKGECSSTNGGPAATSDDDTKAAEATNPPQAATAAPTSAPTEATAAPTSAPTEATAAPTSAPTEVTVEATSIPDEAPTEVGSQGNNSSEATPAPAATEVAAPVTQEGTPAPDATDTSVLNQVPANTTVTVLDAQGQTQPLATQEAANTIATSDPIWCPQGQAPTPGANGCTNSFSSFDALLTFLSGNPSYQGPGTIYVQQGAYTGGETSIDLNSPSYNLSNINNSDLTITGGWNTSTNTVDPTTTSDFTVPIFIGTSSNPWGGSLIINNITINQNGGTGLTLYSQNDITISNVTVTNSTTGAGAEVNAGRNVNINNSRFEKNKTAGAIIKAGGDVSIASSFFGNAPNARRQRTGLDITSGGSVSLADVVASENREAGATINAGGRVAIANSDFSGTKSMNGTTFLGYGLQVVTPGEVDLSGVTANNNFLWGGSLQAGGDVAITDSTFNANSTASTGFIDDTGLLVTSGGAVSLNNVKANDNRLIGATISATGDVSINGSTFTGNKGTTLSAGGTPIFHGYGLNVTTSGGGIFINTVDASNNTLFGAHLESSKDVIITDSHFDNQTSGSSTDQTGRGLEVISGGNVFLTNSSVSNNQTFGANIQANGNIFLDTVTATNNGSDGVDAKGNCTTVFLNGGNYSSNGGFGLSIVNAQLNQSGSPVFANNGAGDISQDPGTCVFPAANSGGTGSGNSTGSGSTTTSNPSQAAFQPGTSFTSGKDVSFPVTGLDSQLTLNNFLANTKVTNSSNNHLGIFIGNYAYIYSSSGVLQIIALSPFSNSLAMTGP